MVENILAKFSSLLQEPSKPVQAQVENAAGIGGNLHPVYNPYILERIFDYLSFSDLKACRLVCKIWEEESTGHLIKNSIIILDNLEKMNKFKVEMTLPSEENQDLANVTKFKKALAHSPNVHLNESKFIEWKEYASDTLEPSVTEFVATASGNYIKILTLDLARTPEPHLQIILHSTELVNLEKLIIKSEKVESGSGYSSRLPSYIINTFNSVKEIEVAEHYERYSRCSQDTEGDVARVNPYRLGALIDACPNLKIKIGVEEGLSETGVGCSIM